MRDFRELLEGDRVHVFDGAMGTMLYARGVYINRCFDELNLTNPDLVASVHREYARAGADVVETNTYGANAVKLAQYGLDDVELTLALDAWKQLHLPPGQVVSLPARDPDGSPDA